MRIALLIDQLTGGGAEAVVRHLALGLAQRGHRVFAYCLKRAGTPVEQLAAAGVVVREAFSAGPDPLLPLRLCRWFRQDAIELANSHNSAATVWTLPAAKALGIPLVQTRHGGLLGKPARYTRLANRVAPLLDALTIVAEPLRATLPRPLALRALCIPNGLDLPPVAPPAARQALERLCGRRPRGPVVLSVGTISPEKDVCNLLRAFALLRLELLDATLVIIGSPRSPAYGRLVRAQTSRLGLEPHVIFAGSIDQPWQVLAGADVFCLSSVTEAMPLTLIEAMSQRVPIVATAVGAVGRLDSPAATDDGAPRYLIAHRRSGLLAPPGDPRALAEALRETLGNRRAAASRSQKAFADYQQFFSAGPMVCAYERLYMGLVGRTNAARVAKPAACPPPNVLMIGPDPRQIGGMTSVIDALVAGPLRERFTLHRFWPGGTCARTVALPRPASRWLPAATRHLAALIGLARTICRTRTRLVHIHTCSFFSFYRSLLDLAVARLLGCRTCLHIHGARFDEFCAAAGPVARRVIRHGCELADAVIVLAPYWASRLRPFLGAARVAAVPNGVAVPCEAPRRARHTGDGCRFLYLGALCERKGLNELLAAAARMRAADVPFELVLAGPVEPPTQHWTDTVRRLGLETCVQFAGPVGGARKAELLATADCLVLPSHQEGLPMVLLEAAAAGLPFIATSVGAIPELLHCTSAGAGFCATEELLAPMVPPGDPDALAREMIRLAGNPLLLGQIGRRLHARVRQSYDMHRWSQQVADIYARILRRADLAAPGLPVHVSQNEPAGAPGFTPGSPRGSKTARPLVHELQVQNQ